jgi:F420-dependent oxidoreductase-like protein
MRSSIFTFPSGIDSFVEESKAIAADGFATIWVPQTFGLEVLTAIAVAGREVPGIHFGTAVVPTYPRHPATMASLALTAQDATKGRLILGIGLSHKVVIDGMYGMSFDKPARHMREHLSILLPLLKEGKVAYEGSTLTFRGGIQVKGAAAPPVLLAALAPEMLKLAGSMADGTVTWMAGPRTVEDHIIPGMAPAAAAAGRTTPITAAGLPFCLTNDPDAARARAAKELVIYGQLPSYRAVLDREGAAGPADIAVVGDEAAVAAGVRRMADAGADELVASIFGSSEERERTRAFLKTLL